MHLMNCGCIGSKRRVWFITTQVVGYYCLGFTEEGIGPPVPRYDGAGRITDLRNPPSDRPARNLTPVATGITDKKIDTDFRNARLHLPSTSARTSNPGLRYGEARHSAEFHHQAALHLSSIAERQKELHRPAFSAILQDIDCRGQADTLVNIDCPVAHNRTNATRSRGPSHRVRGSAGWQ